MLLICRGGFREHADLIFWENHPIFAEQQQKCTVSVGMAYSHDIYTK